MASLTQLPVTRNGALPANAALPSLACRSCTASDRCLTPAIAGGDLSELRQSVKQHRMIHKGGLLFLAGQPRKYAHVVRSGSIKCYDLNINGKERVCDFHLAGEVIGMEDLDASVHGCFAVALEDSEICEIPLVQLRDLMLRRPSLCREMLSLTTRKVHQYRDLVTLISQSDATRRVASFILSMARRLRRGDDGRLRFRLSMARSDIASYLGIQMETVSRSITALQKAGLIRVRGKRIELCSPEQLTLKYGLH